MVMWTFWIIFILVLIVVFQTTFLIVNLCAIKLNMATIFGKKKAYIIKEGNRIIDYKLIKKEPPEGLKLGEETYAADEKKGIFFKRLKIHIWEKNNTIECDFSDLNKIYPPEKLDTIIFSRIIQRAKAYGVGDVNWQMWLLVGIIVVGITAVGLIANLYFGYQTYEWIRDYFVNQGIIKL